MENGLKRGWCVYLHTTPSNKFYIGITSQVPNRRWKNGHGYKSQSYFYNAIIKYGWDNIQHTVLRSDLTDTQAKRLEVMLISKLNTTNRTYGYNSTNGGDGVVGYACPQSKKDMLSERMSGTNNPMYGVSLKGMSGEDNPMYGKPSSSRRKVKCITTDEDFDCVSDGADKYGTHRSDINKVCNGKRKYAGMYNGLKLEWRYINE